MTALMKAPPAASFLALSQPDQTDRDEAAAPAAAPISSRAVPAEDRWLNYSPEQKAAALDIEKRRNKLGLSLPKFCEYSLLDPSVWSKVAGGTYKGSIPRMLKEAATHIEMLETAQKRRVKRPAWNFVFHEWDDVRAAKMAVGAAFDSANDQQEGRFGETISLVDLVMPSGWGKDEIYGELSREFGGALIRARGSWRNSQMAAAASIAAQLEIPLPKKWVVTKKGKQKSEEPRFWRSYDECEAAILDFLKAAPRVLYFMELDLCEVALCDLWKEISNETRCVVVRFWVPESYAKMIRQTGGYGEQTNARTERVITASPVPVDMVTRLFADHAPQVQIDDKPAAWLAAYCTELQGMRAVIGVAREMALDDQIKPGRSVSLSQVQEHAKSWRTVHGLQTRQVAADVAQYMPKVVWP